MKMFLYSVKDADCGFSQPFVYASDALALRAFIGSCRSESPNLANIYPEKKSLWKVGEFDDKSGEFVSSLGLIAQAESYVLSPEEIEKREVARRAAETELIAQLQSQVESYKMQNMELTARLNNIEGGKKCKKSKKLFRK